MDKLERHIQVPVLLLVLTECTRNLYQSASVPITYGGSGSVQGTIDISDCEYYKNLTKDDIRVAIIRAEGYNVHYVITVDVAAYNASTGVVTFNYNYSTSVPGRNITISVCAFA